MSTLYILYDKDRDKYYIGQTNNLQDRIGRHFQHRSKYTKSGTWELVYSEEYSTRADAMKRESYLKSLKDKQIIANLVRASRS